MQIQGIIGAIPHSEYKRRRAGWNPRRPEDRRPTMKECAVCLSICSAGSVLRSPGWPATPTPIVSRWLRPYHRPQSAYPASPLNPTQPPQPAYPRWMPPSAASTTSRSKQSKKRGGFGLIPGGCRLGPHPLHPDVGHEPTDRLPHRIRAVDRPNPQRRLRDSAR